MDKELWLPVDNTRYLVSNQGRVKNHKNLIMKPCHTNGGYHRISLHHTPKIRKSYLIHRLVALAFIAKILATIPVYSKQLKVETVGLITVTSQVIDKVTWINALGISIARLVMLFAFLILVLVSLKIKDKKIIALLIYLLIISTTLVSVSYVVFHITLLLMLAILFLSYRKNYLRLKSLNAGMVMYSFLALLVCDL